MKTNLNQTGHRWQHSSRVVRPEVTAQSLRWARDERTVTCAAMLCANHIIAIISAESQINKDYHRWKQWTLLTFNGDLNNSRLSMSWDFIWLPSRQWPISRCHCCVFVSPKTPKPTPNWSQKTFETKAIINNYLFIFISNLLFESISALLLITKEFNQMID